MAAVAALIYSVVAGGLSAIPFIGGLCSLLVGLPVAYGFAIVMFGVYKGKDIDFGHCVFTFGTGFFFLQPYVQVAHAAFYEDLKAQQGGSIEIDVEAKVEI